MHIKVMSIEYVIAINSQLSHGLDFEKKYIESTLNKMLKVELGMIKRELKQVKNSLTVFEKRHKMSSDEFYEKFNAGKLGDDREYIKWYAYKDTFDKLIERSKEIEKIVHA
ncbi:Uncharacterised protein [uncultured archaeon]|nr:Uncharacterised protein [uncultured archaeon]